MLDSRASIHTDSKAFRDMHRRVCAKIAGRKSRPYTRWRNGDLAAQWGKMLVTRGCDTVRVIWIKGHTGGRHEEWGLARAQEDGNRDADEAAELAPKRIPGSERAAEHGNLGDCQARAPV